MSLERILTIGAFGFDERSFLDALVSARVDVLVDIRQRRGVRGAEYAFVNHQRLVAGLAAAGVGYRYEPGLAPTDSVRAIQHAADAASKTGSRARTEVVPEFKLAYRTDVLDRFDVQAFVDSLEPNISAIAFFCVEQHPPACHRSIVASRFESDLGLPVEHLIPR